MTGFEYVGSELDLFAHARKWKRYWSGQVGRYLGARNAEVGAGIGTNVALLGKPGQEWSCVEPDPRLAGRIEARVQAQEFSFPCQVIVGGCSDLDADALDCVLYIDVLEHILDDRAEVAQAATKLRTGGHLVTLSPAHPFLYSEFDAAIGHHRRYTRASILRLTPDTLRPACVRYLDAVGLLASLANRFLLRSTYPNQSQIRLWDSVMVPCSRVVDPLSGYRLGKSVLCVWQRQ
jgi:SAM-dependent methyltransferase